MYLGLSIDKQGLCCEISYVVYLIGLLLLILKNIANIAFSSSLFFIFYFFTFFVFTNLKILVTVFSVVVRTTKKIKLFRVI